MSYRTTWSDQEIADLRRIHASRHSYKSMLHLWPGRTYDGVVNMAARLKLGPRPCLSHDYSAILVAMLAELANGDFTGCQLAAIIGCHRENPGRILRKNIKDKVPQVHIVNWVRSRPGGCYIEVWRLGKGKNAPKPARKTADEYRAMRRMRNQSKSKQVNPFLIAAGLAEAPTGQPGRVYHHLWDDKEAA